MRTTNWLALFAIATTATAGIACGDDTGTGGSGGGATGGGGNATTASGGAGTGATGGGGSATGGSATGGSATGGSSTGGSGVGGSPMADFTDACPPNVITLVPGQSTTLSGTTTGATDDYQTFCADASATTDGLDVVVGVTLTGTCTFKTQLDEHGNFDGAVSLRKSNCATEVGGDFCINQATSGESYSTELSAGTYYFVVDAKDASAGSGDFDLTLSCAVPKCGDGVVNAGEQCDPGTNTAGDGCGDPGTANACKVEAAVAANKCNAIVGQIDVAASSSVTLPTALPLFSNAAATDDYQGLPVGNCFYEPGGKDQVFAVHALAAGTLSATLEGSNGTPACVIGTEPTCLTRVLYIRTDCADATSQVACEAVWDEDPPIVTSATVAANQTVYVFVDGYDDMSYSNGPYAIKFSLTP